MCFAVCCWARGCCRDVAGGAAADRLHRGADRFRAGRRDPAGHPHSRTGSQPAQRRGGLNDGMSRRSSCSPRSGRSQSGSDDDTGARGRRPGWRYGTRCLTRWSPWWWARWARPAALKIWPSARPDDCAVHAGAGDRAHPEPRRERRAVTATVVLSPRSSAVSPSTTCMPMASCSATSSCSTTSASCSPLAMWFVFVQRVGAGAGRRGVLHAAVLCAG